MEARTIETISLRNQSMTMFVINNTSQPINAYAIQPVLKAKKTIQKKSNNEHRRKCDMRANNNDFNTYTYDVIGYNDALEWRIVQKLVNVDRVPKKLINYFISSSSPNTYLHPYAY